MSFWWWTLAALAAFLITAVGVIIWLLAIASHAQPGTDQANARLDAVRTGLAAGAGAAAAVGLVLAFRRQHHQEIATELTDRDATERRITELYTKAVEQLGSDKAPVRLGGLYALERLAQDNSKHRQTIVDVICAYLRMPFSPAAPTDSLDPQLGPAWQQERQVRLTAQRILPEHLCDDQAEDRHPSGPSSTRYWPGIRLDLTGASLIDLDLQGCVIADVDFTGATFVGDARFDEVTFTGNAVFRGSTFGRLAVFDNATFTGGAVFDDATFTEDAMFGEASFTGDAVFMRTTFDGDAMFGGAIFNDDAAFIGVTFNGDAGFGGATFNGIAGLVGSTFAGESGWRLGPDGSGGYTFVRENDNGGSDLAATRADTTADPGR